jgi:putative transposase
VIGHSDSPGQSVSSSPLDHQPASSRAARRNPARTITYATNGIESLNARFRQATRRRGHFPTEQAALKVLYLVIRSPLKNRANVTGKTPAWKAALNALSLYNGDRITLH